MRSLFLLFISGFVLSPSLAQVVTTQPTSPSANVEITITIDVSKAQDSRAKGLLGKTDDVYLWSGAGTTDKGNAFEYLPANQNDFSKPFDPGRMTSLGNNRWQIKLVPRAYFNVPATKPIRQLGLLLKSGDGKAQTEDFFVAVADTFARPAKPPLTIADLPAGLHDGVNYLAPDRVVLSLFAPHKSFVYVIGEFNNWQASAPYLMNRTPDSSRYWLELKGLKPGEEVAYQYLVDGELAVADPYTDKILDPANDKFIPATTYPNLKSYPTGATGIVSILQTAQTPYTWKVPTFQRPATKSLMVYELLVRDFVGTRNFKTLSDTLNYLKRLGINTIELMPVTEFSGNDSWGYNPIFYFAPDKAYGPKSELKAFIDNCHQNGIAVILDMVLNQADYEFPYVRLYWDGTKPSSDSPYFNPQATHPFSVFFDFNHESSPTKAFVDRVCQYWLQEYKIDGFRFDLSKGFTQKDSGTNVGAWSAYDASRVAIWKRIYNQIRSYDSTAYILLEHFADNTEEKELADYGMLFWGNANETYRNLVKGNNANPDWLSYQKRGWQHPHVIGYMESHDEERLLFDALQNGQSMGNYSVKNLSTALERAKIAAAFFLAIPGPKLIWQFGEFGYDVSIDQNGRTGAKPLKWEYVQEASRKKLLQVYAALIKLKQTQPAFQTTDFILSLDQPVKRITLNHASNTVFVVGNFDLQPAITTAGFPKTGVWYDFFSGQELSVDNPTMPLTLQPGEFHVFTTTKLPTPEAGIVPWSLRQEDPILATGPLTPENMSIYPNPVSEWTLVELTDTYRGSVRLQLKDPAGRTYQTLSIPKTSNYLQQPLRLQEMPAGLYFLQIQEGKKQVIKKIVKQ